MKKTNLLILALLAFTPISAFGMEIQQKKSSWTPSAWQWIKNSTLFNKWFKNDDKQELRTPIINIDKLPKPPIPKFNPFWANKLNDLREKERLERELHIKQEIFRELHIKQEVFDGLARVNTIIEPKTKSIIIQRLHALEKDATTYAHCIKNDSISAERCLRGLENLANGAEDIPIHLDDKKSAVTDSLKAQSKVKNRIKDYIQKYIIGKTKTSLSKPLWNTIGSIPKTTQNVEDAVVTFVKNKNREALEEKIHQSLLHSQYLENKSVKTELDTLAQHYILKPLALTLKIKDKEVLIKKWPSIIEERLIASVSPEDLEIYIEPFKHDRPYLNKTAIEFAIPLVASVGLRLYKKNSEALADQLIKTAELLRFKPSN